MTPEQEGSVSIEQRIDAPAESVASYISDFRNAREWMVGVEHVEKLAEDVYKIWLESPVGTIEPEVRVIEHEPERVRWTYTSAIEGGGRVNISPSSNHSCLVSYTGEFRLKSKLLNRAARFVGMERFARRTGERSLMRLKHLMEARRNG